MKNSLVMFLLLCACMLNYAAQKEPRAGFDISDVYLILKKTWQTPLGQQVVYHAFLTNGNEVCAMNTKQGGKQVSLYVCVEGRNRVEKPLRPSRYDEIQKKYYEWREVEGNSGCNCETHRSKAAQGDNEHKWDGEL